MREQIYIITNYLRGVWLKRRYILILSWLICPVGWVWVTMLPNQYTSESRVYADTRSILQPLLRGLAIQTDPTQELNLMAKTLLNRQNLETIARETDADVRAETPQEYEAIISELKSNIKIGSTNRENLYTLSYTGEDPSYTKDVVQAALNVFIESALGEKRLDTEQASQIITNQIDEYEARLVEAENDLANFKREYIGFMPGSDRNYYADIEQQELALEEAQLALNETRSRLKKASGQLSRERKNSLRQVTNVRTQFDSRLNALELRLDDLLFRFTERHPDVVETKRQLEELQQYRDSEIARMSPDDNLANNLVYQDLKLTVTQLNNDIASLEVRVARHQEKIEILREKLDTVPDVEAKLTALTRNYNITKEKYDQLLSRRESALISQSVGASSENIKFRVIDPPTLPSSPSGPNRSVYIVLFLIFGVGTGIGVSFIVSQLAQVVSSNDQVYRLTGIPVFGVVSATEQSGLMATEKRKAMIFIMLNILLALTFAAVLAINTIPSLYQLFRI